MLAGETLADAAEDAGSNVNYVRAALTLLKAAEAGLNGFIREVSQGYLPLLSTAAKVRKQLDLLDAYHKATPGDRATIGATIGVGAVWDDMVVPAL